MKEDLLLREIGEKMALRDSKVKRGIEVTRERRVFRDQRVKKEQWATVVQKVRRDLLVEKDHLDPEDRMEGNRYVHTIQACIYVCNHLLELINAQNTQVEMIRRMSFCEDLCTYT